MTVCFTTFGCRLNRAEALQQEADFLARGWTVSTSFADADLVVVRGCSVTARAQHDCEKLVARLRRDFPDKRLVVTGCLPGRSGEERLPPSSASNVPLKTARAFLKVQDGCAGRCTFCTVPRFRGEARSVPFDDVLGKAARFIDAGYREIVLTGCNLALYLSGNRRLDALAERLAALSPSCRLRLGSVEPSPVVRDLLAVMAATDNICRDLHLPVQSGSDRVLAAMRRPYSADGARALAEEAGRLMPNLSLGYDLMAGFPGETQADFDETRAFFAATPAVRAHVFPYSERPGTPAATFPGRIDPAVRAARARALSALADERLRRYAASFAGREADVLVETAHPPAGWTGEHLRCRIEGGPDARIARRARVRVRITGSDGTGLTGTLL